MTTAGFHHVSSFLMRIAAGSFALILIGWALDLGPAPASAQGTPEQRQACQPDAMRLCSEFIPDVDAITACMTKNRIKLSTACRVYFVPPKKTKPKRTGTD
jgi:hypothetical protein